MERTKKNIIELTRFSAEESKRQARLPLRVVLDSVRSLNNVGSVFRTSDAFRVDKILLCGITGCPPRPEIHKTALGAEESVDWVHCPSTLDAVKALQAEGYTVCVLEQTHGSVPLPDYEVNPQGRYAIVAGNEINGVAQEVVDAADVVIEIPQLGLKHSLNVAVSTGIALWHFFESMRRVL